MLENHQEPNESKHWNEQECCTEQPYHNNFTTQVHELPRAADKVLTKPYTYSTVKEFTFGALTTQKTEQQYYSSTNGSTKAEWEHFTTSLTIRHPGDPTDETTTSRQEQPTTTTPKLT